MNSLSDLNIQCPQYLARASSQVLHAHSDLLKGRVFFYLKLSMHILLTYGQQVLKCSIVFWFTMSITVAKPFCQWYKLWSFTHARAGQLSASHVKSAPWLMNGQWCWCEPLSMGPQTVDQGKCCPKFYTLTQLNDHQKKTGQIITRTRCLLF